MDRRYAFVVLVALAALGACGQRSAYAPSIVPAVEVAYRAAAAATHAPCTVLPSLHAPVKGNPQIVLAYGQLLMGSGSTRYAFPGVEYAYHGGKYVYAALSGTAKYTASASGFGKTIVITNASGVQTLVSGFARAVKQFSKRATIKVKAGQVIALAGALPLRFEYAPAGKVTQAGAQANPCGSGQSNGASGTISVMPSTISVAARFHDFALDGTPAPYGPYPVGSPDVVTPQQLLASNVVTDHAVAATVYERSDTFDKFYVVLCGNVVFATGPARSAGPFPYPNPTSSSAPPLVSPSLPPLVFFRDPGTQGSSLTAPLPSPYARACPAPGPPDLYNLLAPVFNWVGQTAWLFYTAVQPSPPATPVPNDTVTFTSSSTGIVLTIPASPSPLPVFQYPPAPWPPPSPSQRADIISKGVGSATISVYDSSIQATQAPIAVTVNATPTAAPVPTPMPNI